MNIAEERIVRGIHILREKKVMLDKDLADLYGVKPIRLREQVKRNKKRFPADFMFQLTGKEVDSMVSQNAIPSRKHLGGHNPYVFTEQGVAMLSSILNSERAIQVNIQIMRAFTKLREIMGNHEDIRRKIEAMERKFKDHDQKFQAIFEAIKRLLEPPEESQRKRSIGFYTD